MLRSILKSGINSISTHLLTANNVVSQQVRTTFVLKRLVPVPLHKKNQNAKKLRGRHFNYVLAEDQNIKRQPDIEVVLKQFIDGVGKKGEIVKVRPNFAYNELLLNDLAAYPTPENIEKYKVKAGEVSEEIQRSSPFVQRTINMLQNRVFAVVMNKDEPWVIEPWHIKTSLRKCGYFILSDDAIELPKEKISGPDLQKQGKEFTVTVTINKTEKVNVRCRIHHWSTIPSDRLPYVFEHWLENAEPLFPSEQPTKPTS